MTMTGERMREIIANATNSIADYADENQKLREVNAEMLKALQSCVASMELNFEPAGPTETEKAALEQANAAITMAQP